MREKGRLHRMNSAKAPPGSIFPARQMTLRHRGSPELDDAFEFSPQRCPRVEQCRGPVYVPQAVPQNALSCTSCEVLGSLHVFVSC